MKQKPYTILEIGDSVKVLFYEPTQYADFEAELLEELKGEDHFELCDMTNKEIRTIYLNPDRSSRVFPNSVPTTRQPHGGRSKRSGAIRSQHIANS